jgi:hypothetical protein
MKLRDLVAGTGVLNGRERESMAAPFFGDTNTESITASTNGHIVLASRSPHDPEASASLA